MPNNRQIATLILLAVAALFASSPRSIRSSFWSIMRTLAGPKVAVPFGLMAVWVSGEVWLGIHVELWNRSLTTDTAFWFAFSGVVLFFNLDDASKRSDFFLSRSIAAFGPAVLMEAFLDEFALHLAVEVTLQLLLLPLVLLATVAAREERYRPVANVSNTLAFLIVLGLIIGSVAQLVTDWASIDKADLARQIVLPGWLTIGLLPFIYIMALYSAYELVFSRMNLGRNEPAARWKSRLALIMSLHIKATEVGSFAGYWPHQLARASSFNEARSVLREFRASKEAEVRAEAEATDRLERYAGVAGVDEDGKRLDRREFAETTNALYWLSTCMMGWYRHENRYQADLLERFGDDFTRQGLPMPSGITMRVHEQGQSWYAWRCTATGWVFAIGAAGPPPDQWEYDGPEPPGGFPGEDPSWGTERFDFETSANW